MMDDNAPTHETKCKIDIKTRIQQKIFLTFWSSKRQLFPFVTLKGLGSFFGNSLCIGVLRLWIKSHQIWSNNSPAACVKIKNTATKFIISRTLNTVFSSILLSVAGPYRLRAIGHVHTSALSCPFQTLNSGTHVGGFTLQYNSAKLQFHRW